VARRRVAADRAAAADLGAFDWDLDDLALPSGRDRHDPCCDRCDGLRRAHPVASVRHLADAFDSACWTRGDLDLTAPMAISALTLVVTALFLKSTVEQLPWLLTVVLLVRNALLPALAYQAFARPRWNMLGRWVDGIAVGVRRR
jgi:hypothetical protein